MQPLAAAFFPPPTTNRRPFRMCSCLLAYTEYAATGGSGMPTREPARGEACQQDKKSRTALANFAGESTNGVWPEPSIR